MEDGRGAPIIAWFSSNKADFCQFILNPDSLPYWSKMDSVCGTHCAASSTYRSTSSAYNEIQWCVPLIVIGDSRGDWRMVWANGSRESTNSKGLKGQPCLDPLEMAKGGGRFLPLSTTAVGLLYNTLIISIKGAPKPIVSSTDHKKGHSKRSKAFIASNDRTAAGEFRFWAPSITCRSLLTLSEASLDYIKLVWSLCTSFVMYLYVCI